MSNLTPALNTAFKAARRAGDMIMRATQHLSTLRIDSKAYYSFVSDVVEESEKIIVNILQDAHPNHKILSEKTGVYGNEKSEYEWIINPLDGVTNYVHGRAQYAVSIAFLEKGIIKESLVYAPERNDLYTASRGQGAALNGRRIRVSARTELIHSVISAGVPVEQDSLGNYLNILKEFFEKTAGTRQESVASLELCDLAAGRCDGLFQFQRQAWEIVAGALIVQEAGGIVTDRSGDSSWLQSGDIVAANPRILAQMLQIIGKHLPAYA